MRLKDGVVATVAITEKDDEVETQAPEETASDLDPSEIVADDNLDMDETETTPDDNSDDDV
jgi:hypothetical protein